MHRVKQSTSFEFDFRALDSTGTAVTGKVDGDWTKRIKKSGGSFGAMTVTVTETENGWYKATLSTSHTDTLGALAVYFSATSVATGGALVFTVEANVTADVVALLPTSLDGGLMRAQVKGMDAGVVTASVVATNAIDADALATDAVTEIQSGLATAAGVTSATSGLATASALSTLSTAVAALPSAAAVATAVMGAVTEGSRTVKGVLRRLDALVTGKATGLVGATYALFAADGTTKLVEAAQDVVAGTRNTASTVAGE